MHIFNVTGAKVRIRGRGSGHLEVGGKHEAPVPLMVAITADQEAVGNFRRAVMMTLRLSLDVKESRQ